MNRIATLANKQSLEQKGGFELSQIFEYQDENSFKKGQKFLGDILENRKNFLGKVNFKRTALRNINIFDYHG